MLKNNGHSTIEKIKNNNKSTNLIYNIIYIFFITLFFHIICTNLFVEHQFNNHETFDDSSECNDSILLETNDNISSLLSDPFKNINNNTSSCINSRKYDKLIIFMVDALRYDYAAPITYNDDSNNNNNTNYTYPTPLKNTKNLLTIVKEYLINKPDYMRLFRAIVDPPTATAVRVRATSSGEIPNFSDIRCNAAQITSYYDTWLQQLSRQNNRIVLIGDSMWNNMYSKFFKRVYPFLSFNLEDADFVDYEVYKILYRQLYSQEWDVLLIHTFGIDDIAHLYGADTPLLIRKFNELNNVIKTLLEYIDSVRQGTLHTYLNNLHDKYKELLNGTVSSIFENKEAIPNSVGMFIYGDHGNRLDGSHGGNSHDEVHTLLLAYSSQPFDKTSLKPTIYSLKDLYQIDIVPTIASLMGSPIPYSSLGNIIEDVYVNSPFIDNSIIHDNTILCKYMFDKDIKQSYNNTLVNDIGKKSLNIGEYWRQINYKLLNIRQIKRVSVRLQKFLLVETNANKVLDTITQKRKYLAIDIVNIYNTFCKDIVINSTVSSDIIYNITTTVNDTVLPLKNYTNLQDSVKLLYDNVLEQNKDCTEQQNTMISYIRDKKAVSNNGIALYIFICMIIGALSIYFILFLYSFYSTKNTLIIFNALNTPIVPSDDTTITTTYLSTSYISTIYSKIVKLLNTGIYNICKTIILCVILLLAINYLKISIQKIILYTYPKKIIILENFLQIINQIDKLINISLLIVPVLIIFILQIFLYNEIYTTYNYIKKQKIKYNKYIFYILPIIVSLLLFIKYVTNFAISLTVYDLMLRPFPNKNNNITEYTILYVLLNIILLATIYLLSKYNNSFIISKDGYSLVNTDNHIITTEDIVTITTTTTTDNNNNNKIITKKVLYKNILYFIINLVVLLIIVYGIRYEYNRVYNDVDNSMSKIYGDEKIKILTASEIRPYFEPTQLPDGSKYIELKPYNDKLSKVVLEQELYRTKQDMDEYSKFNDITVQTTIYRNFLHTLATCILWILAYTTVYKWRYFLPINYSKYDKLNRLNIKLDTTVNIIAAVNKVKNFLKYNEIKYLYNLPRNNFKTCKYLGYLYIILEYGQQIEYVLTPIQLLIFWQSKITSKFISIILFNILSKEYIAYQIITYIPLSIFLISFILLVLTLLQRICIYMHGICAKCIINIYNTNYINIILLITFNTISILIGALGTIGISLMLLFIYFLEKIPTKINKIVFNTLNIDTILYQNTVQENINNNKLNSIKLLKYYLVIIQHTTQFILGCLIMALGDYVYWCCGHTDQFTDLHTTSTLLSNPDYVISNILSLSINTFGILFQATLCIYIYIIRTLPIQYTLRQFTNINISLYGINISLDDIRCKYIQEYCVTSQYHKSSYISLYSAALISLVGTVLSAGSSITKTKSSQFSLYQAPSTMINSANFLFISATIIFAYLIDNNIGLQDKLVIDHKKKYI